MAKTFLKVLSPDSFGGGGGFFPDGIYRVVKARYNDFNFGGTVAKSLGCELQPLNSEGNSNGEPTTQQWGLFSDVTIENDGRSIALSEDSQFSALNPKTDYATFVEYLGKAGIDRDSDLDDIGQVLDGKAFEFGKLPRKDNSGNIMMRKANNGKEYPQTVIIPLKLVEFKDAKGKDKKAAGSTPTAVASKSTASASAASSDGEETIDQLLNDYLENEVCVDANVDGIEKIKARMKLGDYCKAAGMGDTASKKRAAELFNDPAGLKLRLATYGWETDGSVIKKKA